MNHVMIFKKTIKKQHCKNVIKLLNSTKLSIGSNPRVNSFYKGLFGRNPYEQEWFEDLVICLNKYKKKHSYLEEIPHWTIDKRCNYQKYKPTQYFATEHHESASSNRRMLNWMFYCNTIKKGGGTFFPQQKFKLKAKEGTAAIWPAGWPYSHLGIMAPAEYKYIVTGWASYVAKDTSDDKGY